MTVASRFAFRRARQSTACLASTVAILMVFTLSAGLPRAVTLPRQRPAAGLTIAGEPGRAPAGSAGQASVEALNRLPLRFEACAPGEFLARAGNCNIHLTATEVALAEQRATSAGRLGRGANLGLPRNAVSLQANEQLPGSRRDRAAPRPRRPAADGSRITTLRMHLMGARRHAQLFGAARGQTATHSFIGNDPKRWQANVPTYSRLRAEQIYRGVDVVYYGAGGRLEYDFNVAPGASCTAIRWRFDGAKRIAVDDSGDLLIDTAAGTTRQAKPVAYQVINGARQAVAARYLLCGRREVRFLVGQYDKRLPLVIDPVLSYATYFGGHSDDRINGVAVDASGNLYIAGTTYSYDLPVKAAIQPAHNNQPDADAFIAKINAAGTELIYSTYLGGGVADEGNAIAVDQAGNVYVTGATLSNDFPVTAGAFQTAPAGTRDYSAFVVKLRADGALDYSTYLGGGRMGTVSYNVGSGIAVDAAGNAYVTGVTQSPEFPTTPDAAQQTLNGYQDAFVSKLNAAGSALVYSTYLGGSNGEHGTGLALDAAGNAYVTGITFSSDFPVTAGALQSHNGSGADAPLMADAFVSKLNATGTALVYSTYFGGSGQDSGSAIAVDAAGNAYVAGATHSFNLPTTAGSLKSEYGGGFYQSGNSGRRWQRSNKGLARPAAYAFAVDPKAAGHLYLDSDDGLYTSTDGGDSWRRLSRQNVINLVIDPEHPSTIYGIYANVIKSTDGGATWAAASNGLPPPFGGYRLFIDPQHPATLYVVGLGFFTDGGTSQEPPPTPHYFFKSTDAGASWQEVVTVPAIVQRPDALVIDPHDTTRLFLNTAYLLYRTQNGGQTWRLMSDHTGYSPLAVDPSSSGILYGHSSSDGIGKSTDDGRTWTKISNGLPPPSLVHDFVAVPTTPTTLYLGTDGGIFKSADGGNNWQEVGPVGNITFLAFDPRDTSTVYTGVYDPEDAFVAKVNASGSALLYATYLGGNSTEEAYAIAVDQAGNAYVTGVTVSSDFPTQSALQSSRPSAAYPTFLAKLNPAGTALLFSTYFGGSNVSWGQAIAVNAAGDVYVAGWTEASDLPTRGAMQATYSGQVDAFLFKVGAPRITGVSLAGKQLVVSGENFDQGAVMLVNGEQQKTENDAMNPTARLISRKAGKRLPQGQAVQVQVRNTDGTLSNPFTFTRNFE